jgi:hypothetical protein
MGSEGVFVVAVGNAKLLPLYKRGTRMGTEGVFVVAVVVSFCCGSSRRACHSAWNEVEAQNPSLPFTFLLLS